MTKIMTIAGQKGGTGKSVTAVNLATSFALIEKSTLLIDCDPQASATQWCGIKALDYTADIARVLSGKATFKDAAIKTEFKYLDVLPAGFDLFQVALKLAKTTENEKMLRLFLKDVEDVYEYIIIDAPSSYGFLSVAAMTAADWLLVCMSVHDNSRQDFHALLRMVKYIRTTHNVPLKIAGLLFNRCDTKEEILSFMENQNLPDIKQMVYDTFIPRDETIQRSIDLKIPAALQNIKSPAAEAYLRFAKELHFFFNKRGVL
ncbi:ParA family protein [Desulfobacula sp.]|uniref:ParA family protein n=1 Tax=Desulfobacula sp. TaxID=2593537 RepID=UPI002634AA9C|nr:ParA family protein [Desulfobacula sp.]